MAKTRKLPAIPSWATPQVMTLLQNILDAMDGEYGVWLKSNDFQDQLNESRNQGVRAAEHAVVEVMRKHGFPVKIKL